MVATALLVVFEKDGRKYCVSVYVLLWQVVREDEHKYPPALARFRLVFGQASRKSLLSLFRYRLSSLSLHHFRSLSLYRLLSLVTVLRSLARLCSGSELFICFDFIS